MPHPKAGYRTQDGERVPGVTTIIGRFKDSGALLWWAFKQGKLAEQGEINSLYDSRDQAADAGTLAHELVETHIKTGATDIELPAGTADDTAEQALAAFKAYLSWESMTKLEIIEQEIQLVSEQYRYGGTPDAIGKINGELCLVDWKTSNGVYPDYLIQLAAYRQLWEENGGEPLTGGFHLCRFAKEHGDFAHHYYPDLSDAWEQFVLFRKAYDIDKILKKRA